MIKIKHFRDLRLPARASISYTLAAALSKAAGLLFTPIFTRIMSAEDYGSFTLYISVLGICTVVCTSLTSGGAMYKGYSMFKDELRDFTAASLGLSAAAALPISLALILFRNTVGLPPELIPFLFVQLICDSAISARLAEHRYLYSYAEAAILTALTSLGTPILSLLLMRAFSGELARVLGLLTVSLLAAFPILTDGIRRGLFKAKMWKFSARYSLPMLPNAIASSVIAQADKLFLAAYMGKEALASYAVAHSIGIGLTFITGSLGAALHPWMMRKLARGEGEIVKRAVGDIGTALGAMTVLVVLLAPEALSLLTPKTYSVALPAILPIALAVMPIFSLSMLAVIAIHCERPSVAAISSAIGAAINVLANLVLIPRLAYLGAGLSLLIAYAAANISCAILLRGRSELSQSAPVKLLLCFFLTALTSLLSAALYPYFPARLALLLLPIIVLLATLRSALGYLEEAG